MEFSDKKAGEVLALGFDLARLLAGGETITGATFSASVLRGSDATPGAMLAGGATIAGSVVKQHVQGGVPGVYYQVAVTATTSAGNTFIERGTLEVTA